MKIVKKKNNGIIRLFIICFIIGLFIAVLFYQSLNKEETSNIINTIIKDKLLFKTSNNGINNIKLLSLILFFSLFYLGVPLFMGILIKDSFKISLKIIFLYKIYKFKGILYLFLYIILNYFIYIVLLYYLYKKIVKISLKLYKNKIYKETIDYKYLYILIKKAIIIIILIFINDYLVYLYGNKLLNI